MESFDLRTWPGFLFAGGDLSAPAMINHIAIDSRRIDSPHTLFVALKGSLQDGHDYVKHAANSGAIYALVQKDWRPQQASNQLTLLRVEDPLKAFQEIAGLYRRQMSATVIGITGSYGKTMLKDLLQAVLSSTKRTVASPESFNSQIGVPISLLTIKQNDEIALIEAGISQQGDMDLLARMISPTCAILTNIGDAHINTLKDIKTTATEKLKLLQHVPLERWSILPNDPLITSHLSLLKHQTFFWNDSSEHLPFASYSSAEASTRMPYTVKFPDGNQFSGIITSGFSYFLDLINIAIKAAWMLEIPSEAICNALKNYVPDHMRTEIWKSPTGITFINNTYCSDPQSVDRALKYLDQAQQSRKVFVFGGMRDNKGQPAADYRRIGKAINESGSDLLFLYGNYPFSSLIEEVSKHSPKTEIISCSNYPEAIKQMRARIKHDDVVLIKGAKKESIDDLTTAFNDSISNNQCIINLSAIQANIETIRNHLLPGTRMMAIVKALAYGTDDVRMAKFLSSCGIDILGVSYVEEGVALRRAGVTQSIFVINAAPYEAAKAVKWNLEVGVSDKILIEALAQESEKQGKIVKVHLHIDTGMSRFGCRSHEALGLAQYIMKFPSLALEGIMTHFPCADMPEEDSFTLQQAQSFDLVIQELKRHGINPPWQHAANSSAAIRFGFPQFNMVRIGLAIYGLHSGEAVRKTLDLRLALSLTSRIVGINHCHAGETISYGRSYSVKRDHERIAVLPMGYFDGLHRNYSGKSHVIIRGHKAPMVGKICMDYMMVDVTDIPNVAVGDNVLIFGVDEHGQYLSPEDLATKGNSIAHELVTCLGPRIQRVFIHEL